MEKRNTPKPTIFRIVNRGAKSEAGELRGLKTPERERSNQTETDGVEVGVVRGCLGVGRSTINAATVVEVAPTSPPTGCASAAKLGISN